MLRKPKVLGYLADLRRANRRMHNKSFTADTRQHHRRYVGDEYFGATDGVLFSDLDVLAIGPIAKEVSADFDRYWPAPALTRKSRTPAQIRTSGFRAVAHRRTGIAHPPRAREYTDSIQQTPFVTQLMDRTLPLEWVQVKMVSDDPSKGLGLAEKQQLLLPKLGQALGQIDTSLDLISAYFVPRASGVEAFGKLAENGINYPEAVARFVARPMTWVAQGAKPLCACCRCPRAGRAQTAVGGQRCGPNGDRRRNHRKP